MADYKPEHHKPGRNKGSINPPNRPSPKPGKSLADDTKKAPAKKAAAKKTTDDK